MFKKNDIQFTIGEQLIYQNLPEDTLSQIDRLIDWRRFEQILSSLHSAKVGRKAYNPVLMLKILIIQQMYGHSDPEMELMLKGNLFYRRFLGLSATDPVPDHSSYISYGWHDDYLVGPHITSNPCLYNFL